MKDKLRVVTIAAVTGAAIGVFWVFAGQTSGSSYWQLWDWQPRIMKAIAYATCPLLDITIKRISIVAVPSLNAIVYGVLIYVILRFAKRPVILVAVILGGAVGVFWAFVVDYAMGGADWPPDPGSWWVYITCPFVGYIGFSGFRTGMVPILNASLYGLLFYALLGVIRRFSARRRGEDGQPEITG